MASRRRQGDDFGEKRSQISDFDDGVSGGAWTDIGRPGADSQERRAGASADVDPDADLVFVEEIDAVDNRAFVTRIEIQRDAVEDADELIRFGGAELLFGINARRRRR
jgi:hypothetical protein